MKWCIRKKSEIAELYEEISRLNERISELDERQQKLNRILIYSEKEKPFWIGHRIDRKDSLDWSSDLYPILYLYHNKQEYKIPFTSFKGWHISEEECELRFEGALAYFDATFRWDRFTTQTYHFIIDYHKGCYVGEMRELKEE